VPADSPLPHPPPPPKKTRHPTRTRTPCPKNRLWRLGGPLLVQNVLSFSLSVTPLAFVGHLDDAVALSGVVLASSVYNITGFSIMCGLAAGSETLCGQAFGARQHRVLGAVALRAFCVCLAAALPVLVLWSRLAEPLLLMAGQRPAVVAVAALYLRQVRPALFFAALSEVLKRYLLAQRVVVPGVAAVAVSAALAPAYCYALVFSPRFGRGAAGAGPAFVLSSATGASLLLAYVVWRDAAASKRGDRDATFAFGSAAEAARAALSGWPSYLSFALPALVQMSAEWWFYEVAILIAGAGEHGDVEGGAAGLCFQVSALVFMSAMAIGSSVNTRVANELGAGRARTARRAAAVAMAMTLLMQGALVGGMLAARGALLGAFTNSARVTAAALAAWMPLAASVLSDAANCILSGVLRGAGRQSLGAGVNLAGYWAVGMPLCFFMGRRYELWGLWAAIATTSTGVAGAQAAIVARLDWAAEVARAAALAAEQARGGGGAVGGEAGGGADGSAAAAAVTAYSGLRTVGEAEDEEEEEEEEGEAGGRWRDQERRRPATRGGIGGVASAAAAAGAAAAALAKLRPPAPLAAASSRELPLALHGAPTRTASVFSVDSGGGASFTAGAR